METTKTGIIIALVLYALFITAGFLILQSALKEKESDLNYCTSSYNDLSWQYYYNCSYQQQPICDNEYCCIDGYCNASYYKIKEGEKE